MDYFAKEMEEKFLSLPKDIQDAIVSVEVGEKVAHIGKTNGLHLDKTDLLLEEVANVMLGNVPTEEFPLKIQRKLGLTDEQRRNIVKSIDEEVFHPIRTSLMTLTEKKKVGDDKDDKNLSREQTLEEIEHPIPLHKMAKEEAPAPSANPPVESPKTPPITQKMPQALANESSAVPKTGSIELPEVNPVEPPELPGTHGDENTLPYTKATNMAPSDQRAQESPSAQAGLYGRIGQTVENTE